MATLRALSWNVCKFGKAKLSDGDFLDYVTRVITYTQADVVGLMEVVGWIGNELRDALRTRLAAATKDAWEGYASEMTACRPDEQYIILARSSKVRANPNALPTLNTVTGGDSFDAIFAHYQIDADSQVLFWTALMSQGYIDNLFQLSHAAWLGLQQPGAVVNLGTAFPMTVPMQTDVTIALARNEPQMFPVRGARPPFYGLFNAQGSSVDVLVLLFHAPGPGSALPVIASNQIPLLFDVQNAKAGIVFGDFNVSASDDARATVLQTFDFTAKRLMYVRDAAGTHVATYPFQRLIGPAYKNPPIQPGSSGTLNYRSAIPQVANVAARTSLGTAVPATSAVPDAAALFSVRSSAYDRIFVFGGTTAKTTATVVDLIDLAIDKNKKTTGTAPDSALQSYVASAYNNWWDAHSKNPGPTLGPVLANCPKLSRARTFCEAFYTYRMAVSDHLPVLVEFDGA